MATMPSVTAKRKLKYDALHQKELKLREILGEMGNVAVALSGGADSAFLLAEAAHVNSMKVMAVTVTSISYAEKEKRDAAKLASLFGVRHRYLEVDQMEMHVVDGGNMDDLKEYRPGARALEELGIRSPMQEAGLTKEEIRALSREIGLFTASKPSYACLASRIPYGEPITPEKLARVEAAETYLSELGFDLIRVRAHGALARIEVDPHQITLLAQERTRSRILDRFKELGFQYVTADLQGFRSGSLDERLEVQQP